MTAIEISRSGRWCLAAAAAVFTGVLVGPMSILLVAGALVVAALRRSVALVVLALLIALAVIAGMLADRRADATIVGPVPTGQVVLQARLSEDPAPQRSAMAVAIPLSIDDESWPGPPVAIGPLPLDTNAGDVVTALGRLFKGQRRMGNDIVAGRFDVVEVISIVRSRNPFLVVGNAIRDRVRSTFDSGTPADALMLGLIMGDTSKLPARSMEDLRMAGLAHFVAVSGSNVALFLMAWWIIGAPLAVHPRIRTFYGFAGLVVFVVVTRWEPSVVRASVMAAVLLTSGLLSVPIDPWMALGIAVSVLLLVSAQLAHDVGFLLSVFATAGVLIGVQFAKGRSPPWFWVSLLATIGAQIAVAPIILAVFGSIPLVAPVANLVAAPVVTVTTAVGLAAITLPLPLIPDVARVGADMVLWIAERTADGPQLGAIASLGVVTVGVLAVLRFTRPVGIAIACMAALAISGSGPAWPAVSSVVVMDVGQGDAILIKEPSGRAMLVDGGRDPRVLDKALRRHGVSRLDAVVITHGDADHVGGLVEIFDSVEVDSIWIGAFGERSTLLDRVLEAASTRQVPVIHVQSGQSHHLGAIDIEILGPSRRYLAENDGSVTLLVSARRSMLLTGDIEAIAQGDLPPLRPYAMVVPHHGSASTDLRWLQRTVSEIAVLSYGENTYGHPHPDILDVLERSGVSMHETHEGGDVVVLLE